MNIRSDDGSYTRNGTRTAGVADAQRSARNVFFFFQAEDGIRDKLVTGVQTCALPISDRLETGDAWPRRLGHRRRALRDTRLRDDGGGRCARDPPPRRGPGRGGDRRSEERRVGKSVDLGGRRIIKKKKEKNVVCRSLYT